MLQKYFQGTTMRMGSSIKSEFSLRTSFYDIYLHLFPLVLCLTLSCHCSHPGSHPHLLLITFHELILTLRWWKLTVLFSQIQETGIHVQWVKASNVNRICSQKYKVCLPPVKYVIYIIVKKLSMKIMK